MPTGIVEDYPGGLVLFGNTFHSGDGTTTGWSYRYPDEDTIHHEHGADDFLADMVTLGKPGRATAGTTRAEVGAPRDGWVQMTSLDGTVEYSVAVGGSGDDMLSAITEAGWDLVAAGARDIDDAGLGTFWTVEAAVWETDFAEWTGPTVDTTHPIHAAPRLAVALLPGEGPSRTAVAVGLGLAADEGLLEIGGWAATPRVSKNDGWSHVVLAGPSATGGLRQVTLDHELQVVLDHTWEDESLEPVTVTLPDGQDVFMVGHPANDSAHVRIRRSTIDGLLSCPGLP